MNKTLLLILMLLSGCAALQQQEADIPLPAATARPDPQAQAIAAAKLTELTVEEAILLALENNQDLKVRRLTPAIRRTQEEFELGRFDPLLDARLAGQRTSGQRLARAGEGRETAVSTTFNGEIGLQTLMPTGTQIALDGFLQSQLSSLYADPFHSSRLGLTVTQSLLRGLNPAANLADLEQARLDTRISEFELRGYIAQLVSQVEQASWDYLLAGRTVEIQQNALQIAELQQAATDVRIEVGKLAESERIVAETEVALRRQELASARRNQDEARWQLLRLLNVPAEDLWRLPVQFRHAFPVPASPLGEIQEHLAIARRLRPDANQARLALKQGRLKVIQTRHGLLPKLDLFATLGKSGFAANPLESLLNLGGEHFDFGGGLTLELPLNNYQAHASHAQATLTYQQSRQALQNLEQLIELEVQSAYLKTLRTQEEVTARQAMRRLQEEKLRIETEKFALGRSQALLVALVQRELLASNLAESQAIVTYLKALAELYRLDGSLLQRKGIEAPGEEMVGE